MNEVVTPAVQTAPPVEASLKPLENHLNGSVHNAGAAIKSFEAWFHAEIAKLRAEFSKEKGE